MNQNDEIRNLSNIDISLYSHSVTHHVCDILNALCHRPEVSAVTLITETSVPKARLALGWQNEQIGSYRHIKSPTGAEIAEYVKKSSVDSVHIFVGMRHLTCVTIGIKACIAAGRRLFIMHEPRAHEGWRGMLRFIQSWLTEGQIRKNAIILAIGALGERWFLRTGYRSTKIFPFAYFIDAVGEGGEGQATSQEGETVRIGYVGRLEIEKGIIDLLNSISHIKIDFQLSIVGDGSQAKFCRDVALRDRRVTYLGALPVSEVQRHMRNLDIIIQPSQTSDDGWCVVVSEALLSGAAVITSNVVGASICLDADWRGRVVPVKNPQAIAGAIEVIANEGVLSEEARRRRRDWANSRLTADAGADYLLRIIGNVSQNRVGRVAWL